MAIVILCVHTLGGKMDPNLWLRLERLNRIDLMKVKKYVDRRLEDRNKGSVVVEYVPHRDGHLQAEKRSYIRKDGRRTERGPYWYFRHHEDGKQKTMYMGKMDLEEAKAEVDRKRGIDGG